MQQLPEADGYNARTIELLNAAEFKPRYPQARDKLFLIEPDFVDPAYPGQRFYCWHCALVEGLLASFPYLADRLDVIRVAWSKPRVEVIALLGPENQSLPVLILADDAQDGLEASVANGHRFVDGKDAILRVLSLRHGIPIPHP